MSKPVGKPPKQERDVAKVTVVLRNSEIAYLDRLRADIRQNTGVAIQRAEIIRALIGALMELGLDVSNATNEEKLKELFIALRQAQDGARARGQAE